MNDGHQEEHGRRGWVLLAGSLVSLVLVVLIFMWLGASMSTTGPLCHVPESPPECSSSSQQWMTYYVPLIGLAASLVIGMGGAIALFRRRDSRIGWWACTSWIPVLVALLVSYGLARSGPSADYLARQQGMAEHRDRQYVAYLQRLPTVSQAVKQYTSMFEDLDDFPGLARQEPHYSEVLEPQLIGCGQFDQSRYEAKHLRVHRSVFVSKHSAGSFVLAIQDWAKEHGYRVKEHVPASADGGRVYLYMLGPAQQQLRMVGNEYDSGILMSFNTPCYLVEKGGHR